MDSNTTAEGSEGFTFVKTVPHEAKITRLAGLDPVAYNQQRDAAAKVMGVCLTTLDELVEAQRPMPDPAPLTSEQTPPTPAAEEPEDFALVEEAPAHEAEITRLAALDLIGYEQEREAASKTMGIRVSVLDEVVKAKRPMPNAATGRGVSLPMVEPWESPVNAAELLDGLVAAIQRHVILRPAAADAVALWIAHTWVSGRFQHTPRLAINSPVKRCGKTTLLEVLRATCFRPLKADNISASGVFRTIEALVPLTLLLDEADTYLGANEELRGVLNSGFERRGEVIRVVEVQGEHQPLRFRTFCPVALAGIGTLPSTLQDRSVPITLQRKGATEMATKLRAPGARAKLTELASKAARWAKDREFSLSLNPFIPELMGDREGDLSVPLLAVADDAGSAWGRRARTALLEVFGKRELDETNVEHSGLLLADLRDLFRERGATRLPSAVIVAALAKMEERLWPEWRAGRAITVVQLARMLAPFGVRPMNMRNGFEGVVRGYTLDSFNDPFSRYLRISSDTPRSNRSTATSVDIASENDTTSRYTGQNAELRIAASKPVIPSKDNTVAAVAVDQGGVRVEGGWSAEF